MTYLTRSYRYILQKPSGGRFRPPDEVGYALEFESNQGLIQYSGSTGVSAGQIFQPDDSHPGGNAGVIDELRMTLIHHYNYW
jgi:hypothetical protein